VTSWLVRVALALLTLTGVLFLQPRPSVSPSSSPDLANPFYESFTIANTNVIPLRDAGVSIAVIEILGGGLQFDELNRPPLDSTHLSELTQKDWNHHNLDMDEKYTITPDIFAAAPGQELSGADIAIVVKYRPWFLPITRQRVFRFITHRNDNRTFSWHSFPIK
jgi:hypothetical protein